MRLFLSFQEAEMTEMTSLVRDQTSSDIKVPCCSGTVCFIMYSRSVAYATELRGCPDLGAGLEIFHVLIKY